MVLPSIILRLCRPTSWESCTFLESDGAVTYLSCICQFLQKRGPSLLLVTQLQGGSPLTQVWFGLRLSNGNAAIPIAIQILTEVLCTAQLLLTAELLNRIILSNRFLLTKPILTSEQIISLEQQQLLLLSQDVHLWLEHHLHKEVAGKHLKDL